VQYFLPITFFFALAKFSDLAKRNFKMAKNTYFWDFLITHISADLKTIALLCGTGQCERGCGAFEEYRVQGFCTEDLIVFFSIRRSRVFKSIAECHELISTTTTL
jgi:hypothetical protein